jgi:hypothetical protein
LPARDDALNNFRIGSQLFNKGKYEGASFEFEKALSKKPGDIKKMKEAMHGKMEGCISKMKAEQGEGMIGMCIKMFEQAMDLFSK